MEFSRAEKVLNLYDYCWFELQILKIKQPFLSNSSSSEPEQDHREETTQENVKNQPKPEISRVLTHHNRSMSDQAIMNATDHSPPKLCTILSGKEIPGFENPETENLEVAEPPKKKVSNRRSRRRRKGCESKSLSDLEFEELKGFMDLGFVFSEEDRESSLASIIPGLQRLGQNNKELRDEKENEGEEEEKKYFADGPVISRPYLSEAWEVFDIRPKRENPLLNWRIPALENEIDMKDNLKWWAHTVASTVR